MTKTWQIGLVLLAIFVAGGASGGFVAYSVARRAGPFPPGPEGFMTREVERVTHAIKLSDEQTKRIESIVKRNATTLIKLRRESMDSARKIFEQMEKEISAELTPEQRAQYAQIMKANQEARRRMIQERGNPPSWGDRPMGGGPPPIDGQLPPPPGEENGQLPPDGQLPPMPETGGRAPGN